MKIKEVSKIYLAKLSKNSRLWLVKLKELSIPWLARLKEVGRLWLAKLKDTKKQWPANYREFNELILIVLLVIILPVIIIFSPSNVLRIILGLPFVLFLPGYTLMAALYVRKDRIKNPDRLALSFGMSVVITPLIGLFLNYTPWGIQLASFFVVIALFILITSVIAWIRRGRLLEEERFSLRLRWRQPALGVSVWNKAPAVILGLAALAVVGSLVYVIIVPKTQESYTEFYISGLEDKTVYPAELTAGVEQKVLVTIVNRERRILSYRIEVSINRVKTGETGTLALEHGQKYEAAIGFTPETIGDRQLVEFTLYINGESEPYLKPLQLWVNVK